jgi:hypothetical protein
MQNIVNYVHIYVTSQLKSKKTPLNKPKLSRLKGKIITKIERNRLPQE